MEGRKAMKEEKANKDCSVEMKEAVFKELKNSKWCRALFFSDELKGKISA